MHDVGSKLSTFTLQLCNSSTPHLLLTGPTGQWWPQTRAIAIQETAVVPAGFPVCLLRGVSGLRRPRGVDCVLPPCLTQRLVAPNTHLRAAVPSSALSRVQGGREAFPVRRSSSPNLQDTSRFMFPHELDTRAGLFTGGSKLIRRSVCRFDPSWRTGPLFHGFNRLALPIG